MLWKYILYNLQSVPPGFRILQNVRLLSKSRNKLGVVVHAYNPSIQEVEAERLWVQNQPRLHSESMNQKRKEKKKRNKCQYRSIYKTIEFHLPFINFSNNVYPGFIQDPALHFFITSPHIFSHPWQLFSLSLSFTLTLFRNTDQTFVK
jgi:hypothetical protein